MDFLTRMETRKSCRAYQDKPVSREDLMKLVRAGQLTPSACNSQPWKFIKVSEFTLALNFTGFPFSITL
jgi:nitroreductase